MSDPDQKHLSATTATTATATATASNSSNFQSLPSIASLSLQSATTAATTSSSHHLGINVNLGGSKSVPQTPISSPHINRVNSSSASPSNPSHTTASPVSASTTPSPIRPQSAGIYSDGISSGNNPYYYTSPNPQKQPLTPSSGFMSTNGHSASSTSVSSMGWGNPSPSPSPAPSVTGGGGAGGSMKSKRPLNFPKIDLPPKAIDGNKSNTVFNQDAVILHGDKSEVTIPTQTVYLPNGEQISPNDLKKLEEIGRGNYGSVFRCIHERSGTVMAVKNLPMDINEEAKKEQLIRELNILGTSKSDTVPCPYIVKYYGAYFREGDVCICMEYMDSGCFDIVYKKTGPIPEEILGKVAFAVVSGLNYLKTKLNTIHRDIKPSNILLNTSGEIKLCDFGISGKLENSLARTYVGTNHYMAPERIKQAAEYDIRSDVWSLGITLVELAHGKYPYGPSESSIFGLLKLIVEGDAPKLDAERFSPSFVSFVDHCLQKDPAKRANYVSLLETDFLKTYKDKPVDVASWSKTVTSQIQEMKKAEAGANGNLQRR